MPVAEQHYIIPFVECLSHKETLRQVWFLLERNGTHLIPIPGGLDCVSYVREFLETNDMVARGPSTQKGAYIFVPVDQDRTDLSQFWSWKEVAAGTTPVREAWRTFFWAAGPGTQDPWGVNHFLREIQLADGPHTAYDVLAHLFSCGGAAA